MVAMEGLTPEFVAQFTAMMNDEAALAEINATLERNRGANRPADVDRASRRIEDKNYEVTKFTRELLALGNNGRLTSQRQSTGLTRKWGRC